HRVGPKKQMIGSDARRVVAMVADKHTCRDWAEVQFPGEPMGAHVSAVHKDFAIAASSGVFIGPTATVLSHSRPEAILCRPPDTTLSHDESVAR
ncbi:MAG TPA: hypothetical protein VKB76_00385, partial [Ktedonobacterales bacterium]|nr:hypothetical protein [Ktedonobacterales bacterium]